MLFPMQVEQDAIHRRLRMKIFLAEIVNGPKIEKRFEQKGRGRFVGLAFKAQGGAPFPPPAMRPQADCCIRSVS